jgi:protein-S-isoprenylcysteine O-methyltransferase Ste14
MKTGLRAAGTGTIGFAVFGLLLFVPARTFDYWQAWIFLAVFTIPSGITSAYLAVKDPAALERRMHAGPAAEARTGQKVFSAAAFLLFPAVLVFSAFDHRFGWSPVPTAISLIGDALVAIGLGTTMLVVIQNRYAASNITVEAGQSVVSSGLYSLVRHPMYLGSLIMMIGIPLALDSAWGLLVLVPTAIGLVYRIRDEEKLLEQELAGYREYERKVRCRLLPYVW